MTAGTISESESTIDSRKQMFVTRNSSAKFNFYFFADPVKKREYAIFFTKKEKSAFKNTQQKINLDEIPFDPKATPIWELAAEISAQLPVEEWEKLPTDLARNFDYYQKLRNK